MKDCRLFNLLPDLGIEPCAVSPRRGVLGLALPVLRALGGAIMANRLRGRAC